MLKEIEKRIAFIYYNNFYSFSYLLYMCVLILSFLPDLSYLMSHLLLLYQFPTYLVVVNYPHHIQISMFLFHPKTHPRHR